jgi:hypothetical protein
MVPRRPICIRIAEEGHLLAAEDIQGIIMDLTDPRRRLEAKAHPTAIQACIIQVEDRTGLVPPVAVPPQRLTPCCKTEDIPEVDMKGMGVHPEARPKVMGAHGVTHIRGFDLSRSAYAPSMAGTQGHRDRPAWATPVTSPASPTLESLATPGNTSHTLEDILEHSSRHSRASLLTVWMRMADGHQAMTADQEAQSLLPTLLVVAT